MTEPATIREHLEAIRDLNEVWGQEDPDIPCCHCFNDVQSTQQHAVAALALLDNANHLVPHAPRMSPPERVALVPDPAPPKETDAPTAT